MSNNVSVMGVQKDTGDPLKASLAAFRKHHSGVSDALLNITEGLDPDDPRAAVQFQPWPTMLYHADGRFEPAADKSELGELQKRGFRREPYPKPQVQVLDPATEKKALLQQNQQLQGQITSQSDIIEKLAARLEALEGK